uniref:Variant surface glycoprotein 1125.1400 n=1 Tax=Trypanosoma brucei TaxID=5691 RepID=A0A1J0R780_9TRYP|nr:variant surface glycoprotein 1125.1400 [Trypanosoma brucei]
MFLTVKVCCLVMAITLWLSTGTVTANKNPIKLQAFTAMCKLSKALKATPAKVGQPTEQMLTKAASYEDLLTDLYSIKSLDPNRSLSSAAAIAFLATQKAAERRVGAKDLAPKATPAAGAETYVAGYIDQMTSIFIQAQASTDLCIAAGSGNTAMTSYVGLEGCLTGDDSFDKIPSAADAGGSDVEEQLAAVAALNGKNLQGSTGECKLTQADNTHGDYGGTTDQPANIYWVNSIVRFTASALAASAFPKDAATIKQVPIIKAALDAIDEAKLPEFVEDGTATLLDKLSDTSKTQKFENFDTTPKAAGVGTDTTKLTIDKADLEALAAALEAYREDPSRKSKLAEARREQQIAVAKQLDEVTTQKQQ